MTTPPPGQPPHYSGHQSPGYSAQGSPTQGTYGRPYAPYGPQSSGYGRPPKKNTGLWIGVAAGLVVVIALVITGFLAPGFFLSKDSTNSGANPPSSAGNLPASSTETPAPPRPLGGGPNATEEDGFAVMQAFIDRLNQQDPAGASALICPGSLDASFQRGIDKAASGANLTMINPVPGQIPNSVGANVTGTVNGKPIPSGGFIGANNKGNGYCMTSGEIFGLANIEIEIN